MGHSIDSSSMLPVLFNLHYFIVNNFSRDPRCTSSAIFCIYQEAPTPTNLRLALFLLNLRLSYEAQLFC